MEKFMNEIHRTRYNHHALAKENGNYQWADWLSYEPLESCGGGYRYKAENGKKVIRPEAYTYWNYLGACYWAMDASMMKDMAQATGRPVDKYVSMEKEARNYLRTTFLNADGTFKADILNTMQTPALFALKNHLVEGEAKANMIARLRKNFEEHGNCLQTGFFGYQYTDAHVDRKRDGGHCLRTAFPKEESQLALFCR